MKKVILLASMIMCVLLAGTVLLVVLTGVSSHTDSNANEAAAKTVVFSPSQEGFITNIKNSSRYLKVDISMEIKEKSKDEFQKNSHKIKDAIISVLRDKTESYLLSENSQENLKADIKDAVANKLKLGGLVDVYINQFIIQ